ncbi:hypothetical protein ABBQ32_013879 [Trebouxia sp. C0010 RCD-2024]
MSSSSVAGKLSREVLRKLRLATDAEAKDDREIVCSEVFADVTGSLDDNALGKLNVSQGTRFYQVLAPYFDKNEIAADDLLHVCRRLWGQPYVAPVYALLLHQWLLSHPMAGGSEQRQKHVNVLISGARQLFWGDVHSTTTHFQPLFLFLAYRVVFGQQRERLDSLPTQSRAAVISVVSCFLPYYDDPEAFPRALENMPVPDAKATNSDHKPGEGANFVLTEVTDTLQKIKAEGSLLKYLRALIALQYSPYLTMTQTVTKLRLQGELYSLTSSGGPRYLPRPVNQAAFEALDSLFPFGRRSRRIINVAFKFLHPSEWRWAVVDAYKSAVDVCKAWLGFWLSSVAGTIRTGLNAIRAWLRFLYDIPASVGSKCKGAFRQSRNYKKKE